MLKKIILLTLLLCIPVSARAADPLLEQPRWSLEAKGGRFTPAIENWRTYYGKRYTSIYAATLAYKVLRQVDIGIGGGSILDRGTGLAPVHGTLSGSVTYELYPINAFVVLRGVFSEKQWLVPYLGGGWTRIYYRERVQGQSAAKGSADGFLGRAGIQFLLDGIDLDAANSMYLDYGVHHTYFFIEAEKTRALVKSVDVDLGGTVYSGGFLFEF